MTSTRSPTFTIESSVDCSLEDDQHGRVALKSGAGHGLSATPRCSHLFATHLLFFIFLIVAEHDVPTLILLLGRCRIARERESGHHAHTEKRH